MSTERILNEDWSDYDNKKKKWEDRFFVSCEETWEVEYILNKMREHYPNVDVSKIKTAIASCCRSIPAPRPREKFIECVRFHMLVN